MDLAKKINTLKWTEIIIFAFLSIFPLGQLIKINLEFLGISLRLQPIDIVVFSSLILYILGYLEPDKIFNKFKNFLIVALFSLIISFFHFEKSFIFAGFLYLLRLSTYGTFYLSIKNYLKKRKGKHELLFNSLLLSFVFVSIFGWIQYFWFADVRFLKFLNWDDHYYRLVGSFLDPAYTAILMVIASLVSLYQYKKTKNVINLLLLIIFSITLAFTYSRAGYVAFIFSFIYLLLKLEKIKIIFLMLITGVLIVFSLPRPSSEGVKLERIHSVILRIQNYKDTFSIYKKYPLFGVGYNNICAAKIKHNGFVNNSYESHSCSGSDSSLLLILATTGIVGFIIFLDFIFNLFRSTEPGLNGIISRSVLLSVFINSLFVNSMFYPWVMGVIVILTALFTTKENT